ncbi:CYTH domain-containing protein [Mucilaginibacter litoreus]|uniref:CYTH domain-containing protein n=1 Tax=Mucilaginibacter litoreus TaxID=1048221 RepID=A0ABW3APJ2_9SPHI
MATEIERKFLVDKDKWKSVLKPVGEFYKQGYIFNEKRCTVRVRLTSNAAFITLKGPTAGISRSEYEYQIPMPEANEMLELFAASSIEKTRYKIEYAGHMWEVDVFDGENNGLIVAEIELQHEHEQFEKPDWAGEDVSKDLRYSNGSLSVTPYAQWR